MSAPAHHLSNVAAAPAPGPGPGPLSSILQKELVASSFANSCKEYLDPTDPSMVTAADRMALVDWCYNIVDNCQYPRETVAMTMGMVDTFLSMPSSTADAARASDEALHNQHNSNSLPSLLYTALSRPPRVTSSSQSICLAACTPRRRLRPWSVLF